MAKNVLDKTDAELLEDRMSFIMYTNYREEYFEKLSDERAGKLIKAIFNYIRLGEEPDEDYDEVIYYLFPRIKKDLDMCTESWIIKTKRNALGGKNHKGNQYTRLKEEREQLEQEFAKKKMEATSNSSQQEPTASVSSQKMEPNGTYGSNNKDKDMDKDKDDLINSLTTKLSTHLSELRSGNNEEEDNPFPYDEEEVDMYSEDYMNSIPF